jgi:hypothetical protein
MSKTRRYLAEYRVRKRNDEGNTRESRGFYPETRQGVYEVKGTMAKAGGGVPGTVIGDARGDGLRLHRQLERTRSHPQEGKEKRILCSPLQPR